MVYRKCYLCKSRYVALHSFPKNMYLNDLWKKICNIADYDKVANLRICSNHFLSTDYIDINAKKFGGQLKLKDGHYPSVKVPKKVITITRNPLLSSTNIKKDETLTMEENIEYTKPFVKKSFMPSIVANTDTEIIVESPISIKKQETSISQEIQNKIKDVEPSIQKSKNLDFLPSIEVNKNEDKIMENNFMQLPTSSINTGDSTLYWSSGLAQKAEKALITAQKILNKTKLRNGVLRQRNRRLYDKMKRLEKTIEIIEKKTERLKRNRCIKSSTCFDKKTTFSRKT